MYFEFHERGFTVAARMGDWKAERLGTKLPIELYDMKTDTEEKHDVPAQHSDVVKRFDDYFKTARTESEAWPIRENVKKAAGQKTAEEDKQ